MTPDEGGFWRNVETVDDDGCWLWTGTLNHAGYGVTSTGFTGSQGAHRVAFVLSGGVIPEGLDLDHLCRTRSCVRPSHLEPVTRGENVRRGWAVNGRRPSWLEPGGRTPARSWKPPPELYERLKAATAWKGETVTNALVRKATEYVEEVEREQGGKR